MVVVTRLDRLARSTGNLLEIAEAIRVKDAGLLPLAEPWADTTSPAGRMVLTVFAGIAEFERELIRQRTDEGRQAAKKRGVTFGRPPKLRPDQQELVSRLLQEGRFVSEVARTSTSTRPPSTAASTCRCSGHGQGPDNSTAFRSQAWSSLAFFTACPTLPLHLRRDLARSPAPTSSRWPLKNENNLPPR